MKSLPHGVIFLLMTFLSHSAYSLLSFNEMIISSEVLRESKVFPFRFYLIETNDISKRYYKLTLRLHIKQEIDSTPRILIWRINEEPIPKNVTISSIVPIKIQSIQAISNDFTISNIENKGDNMKFEFYVKPKPIKKRTKAEIKVNAININTDKPTTLTIYSLIM